MKRRCWPPWPFVSDPIASVVGMLLVAKFLEKTKPGGDPLVEEAPKEEEDPDRAQTYDERRAQDGPHQPRAWRDDNPTLWDDTLAEIAQGLYRLGDRFMKRRERRLRGMCPRCKGMLTKQARGIYRCDVCRKAGR